MQQLDNALQVGCFEVSEFPEAANALIQDGLKRLPRFRSRTCSKTLRHIIEEAYSLRDWEVEGPAWNNQGLYEVAATMPPGTTRATARLMLRRMFADRFELQLHMVRRELLERAGD